MDALRLSKVSKVYGERYAVKEAEVAFAVGRVHAVVGENGAGKSTLLRMAAGLVRADEGRIFVEGTEQPLRSYTAAAAQRRGVGMVEQHFALVPPFTVLENMVLGREPGSRFAVSLDAAREGARRAFEQLGVTVPLDTKVESLGVGDAQRVEIARLLFRGARTLILDEPTALFTAREAERLYDRLRVLSGAGATVIVVTHKVDEVVAFADTVTVLRRGLVVESRLVRRGAQAEEARAVSKAIMGAEPPQPVPRVSREVGEVVLRLDRVSVGRALRDVSLEVRSGEIVGIAGVEGNGQDELVKVIAGLVSPDTGTVHRRAAPAVVHGDRQREGLILPLTVGDNLLLGDLPLFARLGVLARRAMKRAATARRDAVGIVPTDLALPASALSGGNQQKICVARALARAEAGAELLVLFHPTRGVDLGAARAIHDLVRRLTDRRPVGVLLISSDLDELRTLATRLLVLSRGTVTTELPPDASDLAIGEEMLGLGARGEA